MKRFLIVAALVFAASFAQAATWVIVTNADCTGFGAATGLSTAPVRCCTGANSGTCDRREYMGTTVVRFVTVVTGATQTYTAGGDLMTAAQVSRLGMTTVLAAICEEVGKNAGTTGGTEMLMTVAANARCTGSAAPWACCTGSGTGTCSQTTPPVIQAFTSGGTEFAVTANALSNSSFACVVFGYGG